VINVNQEVIAEDADLHQIKKGLIRVASAMRNHQEKEKETEKEKVAEEGLHRYRELDFRVLMTRQNIREKEAREAVKDIRNQGTENTAEMIHAGKDRVRIDVKGRNQGAVREVLVVEGDEIVDRYRERTEVTAGNATVKDNLVADGGMILARENGNFQTVENLSRAHEDGGKMEAENVKSIQEACKIIRGMMMMR